MKNEMVKYAYLMPTSHCNLSCPHCHVKNQKETYDRNAFLKSIKEFDGKFVLFGGEPFFYKERTLDIINYAASIGNPIWAVSTNLMIIDDEIIDAMKSIEGVATSWNLHRFSNAEYIEWKMNLTKVYEAGIDNIIMLITITHDLLEFPIDEFLDIIDEWDIRGIHSFKLELYLGSENDALYFQRADEWLAEVYQKWRYIDKDIVMANKLIVGRMIYDCDRTYTITSNGKVLHSCPQGINLPRNILNACLTCPKNEICVPCPIQPCCPYPHKLEAAIKLKCDIS